MLCRRGRFRGLFNLEEKEREKKRCLVSEDESDLGPGAEEEAVRKDPSSAVLNFDGSIWNTMQRR